MVAVTGVAGMSMSTSIEMLITTRISTAITTEDLRAVKAAQASGSMMPVTERASATKTTQLHRNLIKEQIPRLPSRESSSADGPRAVGRNWRVKAEQAWQIAKVEPVTEVE